MNAERSEAIDRLRLEARWLRRLIQLECFRLRMPGPGSEGVQLKGYRTRPRAVSPGTPNR